MQTITNIRQDFVASHLRSLAATISCLLRHVENGNEFNDGFTEESLKKVEISARQIRKLCLSN